ncbi:MAG: signal peptide peptidase SppA [Pseudomonadota bacterium]
MKAFFARLGAFLTKLRVWTLNLVTLLLLLSFISFVVTLLRQMPKAVDPQGKVLIIAPRAEILDQKVYPAEFSFPFALPKSRQYQTRDMLRMIRAAAADERLAGVVIDFSKVGFSGPTTALNIARELRTLRESGKPVIAFSEVMGTSAFMMASQADEVFVHPSGAVAITGIGGYRDYTRELTEKLKITIHNYSQGDFKSAVEGLTRNDMSDADGLQRRELYAPIWAAMKAEMAAGRGIDARIFQTLADEHSLPLIREGAYSNLAFAENQGVIDGLKTFPEFRDYMIERFGEAEDQDRVTYPHIGFEAYLAQLPPEAQEVEDKVAVVFAEGGIQTGKLGPGVAGSDDIANLLRRAHEDESTRAVVLRVNSPGGSIIASDVIASELVAAKRKGLPVVVSMGDVAASGGVWISTPADAIWSEPTTITGSIGVAVAFPTLENAFEYVGVNFDGVTTSRHAGWGPNLAVDEQLDAMFARWASGAYDRFVDTVASSRQREPEYIRSIAGGRVWIGSKALELGLVDALGSMEDAIADAAERAGIEAYGVNYVVKPPSPSMLLLQQFSAAVGIELPALDGGVLQRVRGLLMEFESLSRPRASVLCTDCVVELL